MTMRISGGSLKGINVATLDGKKTRPTTARMREALFSMLQHDIIGSDFLDIFSGSGIIAVEAISRGAKSAVLIENHRPAIKVIEKNLNICHLDLRLLMVDFIKGLEILSHEKAAFDLIFADPPYGLVDPSHLYDRLRKYHLMKTEALFIMEHDSRLKPEANNIIQTRRFGDSAITVFKNER